MAFKYTNKDNVSLPLAVWLMHDDYDYDKRENVISATWDRAFLEIRVGTSDRLFPCSFSESYNLILILSRLCYSYDTCLLPAGTKFSTYRMAFPYQDSY